VLRTRAYFNFCRPTHLDTWSDALKAMSFETVFIYLNADEAKWLRAGEGWKGLVAAYADMQGSTVLGQLQQALDEFGGKGFVRTQVRSPKDSTLFARGRGQITDPWTAVTMLRESTRFHEDCAWLDGFAELPVLVVRKWLDIPAWAEFRCFIRNGKLVGISQLRRQANVPEPMRSKPSNLHRFLSIACNTLIPQLPKRNVVVDLAIPSWDQSVAGPRAVLLELNPWHALTDAGWFDWRQLADFDGSIRLS